MPDAETLNRNKAASQAIGGSANIDKLVETSDYSILVVEADMSGAALSDLVVEVSPVSEVNDEVYPIVIPSLQVVANVFSAGRAYAWGRWDVSAQQRVRVRFKNANVGAQTLDFAWRLA
jgi:hypothetical protein